MGLILLILLILLFAGAWPSWGYHSLGYGPPSFIGILLIILIVLLLTGRL